MLVSYGKNDYIYDAMEACHCYIAIAEKPKRRQHLRLMLAAAQNKQHITTRSLSDIAHLMFVENYQSKSK